MAKDWLKTRLRGIAILGDRAFSSSWDMPSAPAAYLGFRRRMCWAMAVGVVLKEGSAGSPWCGIPGRDHAGSSGVPKLMNWRFRALAIWVGSLCTVLFSWSTVMIGFPTGVGERSCLTNLNKLGVDAIMDEGLVLMEDTYWR